ncbi:hypothetical protein B0H65DRAFT_431676 [Neurospora tetraspora]|uniref:Uncharacterized protein n=1 Tax=Neurospora tetraspora TaxID=94610 RepID=A0AAE0MQA9_9PEZI|nr:hypothetical protein B0H65DRAFT_431676 [Neurospora tetraspora]
MTGCWQRRANVKPLPAVKRLEKAVDLSSWVPMRLTNNQTDYLSLARPRTTRPFWNRIQTQGPELRIGW